MPGLMSDDAQAETADPATGAALLGNRSRPLGHLLLADRAVFYVQILYQMLVFRRAHELEPLHEDLYDAIRASQESVAGVPYTPDLFLQDLGQLDRWELVSCRIEKERLRGYKDTRRRKFRYRLSDETVAFLLWLEERRREDLQPDDADTRDVLEELVGTLRETVRLMNKPAGDEGLDLDASRGIVYRLSRMTALTYDASRSLGDFNVRLLGFVLGRYDLATARSIIGELEHFLARFLGRIHALRSEIVPELSKLRLPRHRARWQACLAQIESERRATAHVMRSRTQQDPDQELEALARFYAAAGPLDQLCSRVNQAAMLVWRKLYTHLRELERRSHRMQDLQSRVREMGARTADDAVPAAFIQRLLAPAHMIGDMHYWNETENADPPEPRWEKHRTRAHVADYLAAKALVDGHPVRSLEEERLTRLADWMQHAGLAPEATSPVRASEGAFGETDDFARLLDLARHGLLAKGARLRRLGYELTVDGARVEVKADAQALAFRDMLIAKAKAL
jgi:hypothetical protein